MSVALTKSRFSNALRCYGNYALGLLGLVRITHMPTFISVEPAAICQLRCPECPVGQANGKQTKTSAERVMSKEVWSRTLSEAARTAWIVQFYFQGEPLLNKELSVMVAEAHNAGLHTIVSTNAQALTPETAEALVKAGLDRIIVSMDGLSEETYSAYRVGGSLEKTKAALTYLREAKERLKARMIIELQCLRLRTNEHEWEQFKKTYKALGADRITLKTAQLYEYSHGHPLMPSKARYSRYIKGSDGLYHRRSLGRGCLRVWSGVVITTAGDVLPCCYDKNHSYAYGNIMDARLAELFANEKARAFRKAALHEKPQICKECWR